MKLTEVIAQYGALRKAMGEHFDSAERALSPGTVFLQNSG